MFDPENSRGVQQGAVEISASLICARLLSLGTELAELESAGVDSIHLDLMDGHFVPNLGFSLDLVAAVCAGTSLPVDAHLMVERPQMYVGELAKAGIRRCFFHVEAAQSALAAEISDAGMVPGAAISPDTPVEVLAGFEVPSVLVMSVRPGFAGQRWVPGTEGRVGTRPRHLGREHRSRGRRERPRRARTSRGGLRSDALRGRDFQRLLAWRQLPRSHIRPPLSSGRRDDRRTRRPFFAVGLGLKAPACHGSPRNQGIGALQAKVPQLDSVSRGVEGMYSAIR